ncbi:MAG: IS200/IS605 family transposase [Candidatus Bathyarchaeia archaeon]
MKLIRDHHSIGEANLHLQFTPKYRRDIFRDKTVKRVCKESFQETAEKLGLVIHALSFAPDHVHLFVGACKNNSVAEVVRRLKGASSRRIRRQCWNRIRTKLWGKAFWSTGYFYRSVGATTDEAIQYYVENSQRKHWTTLDYQIYKHRKENEKNAQTQTTINQFTQPSGLQP